MALSSQQSASASCFFLGEPSLFHELEGLEPTRQKPLLYHKLQIEFPNVSRTFPPATLDSILRKPEGMISPCPFPKVTPNVIAPSRENLRMILHSSLSVTLQIHRDIKFCLPHLKKFSQSGPLSDPLPLPKCARANCFSEAVE